MEDRETELMVNDFSKLSVDSFSNLTEDLIHRILSFLPTIKEVARTSAVSKSWLRAWQSYPISHFDLADFVSRQEPCQDAPTEAEKRRKFVKFVGDALSRMGRQRNGIKIFSLTAVDEMTPHIQKWIRTSLDNHVQHLVLRVYMSGMFCLTCPVPARVFSAASIKSLKFVGPLIVLPLSTVSAISLPSLTELCLCDSTIRDEPLQKLLQGCPSLEELSLLGCEVLSKVEISDLTNLRVVEVTVNTTTAELTLIRINAPKLEEFSYTCESLYKRNVTVEVNHSPNLKVLRMSDWNKTDRWFNKFIAKFPLLESLTIDWCNALKRIRISNPLLENISIENCNNLEEVLIESQKLSSFFLFSLHTALPKPVVQMENPPSDCVLQIITILDWVHTLTEDWFFRLKEFLTSSLVFRRLNFFLQNICSQAGDMVACAHERLPSPACKIEELRLGVSLTPIKLLFHPEWPAFNCSSHNYKFTHCSRQPFY